MRSNVPSPDLRIVPTDNVHPHEEHDSQRSDPLMEQFMTAQYVINPPVIASIDTDQYVILDGANRCHVFKHLRIPHLLVQVTSYESGYCELATWRHVLSHWHVGSFFAQLRSLETVEMLTHAEYPGIAQILTRDGREINLQAPAKNIHERNAVLRRVVGIYQKNARLNRTALSDPEEIWALFPDAIALVSFPTYTPADILDAAKYQAYLPPGISRHIIHGRALRVNYPLEKLRDPNKALADKNEELCTWIQGKFANRQVRYYAESTYQFDE